MAGCEKTKVSVGWLQEAMTHSCCWSCSCMTSPGRRTGYALQETGCQAAYYKHTAPGSPNRLTRAVTIVSRSTSSIHTHILHTLRGLCNGPI